MIGYRAEGTICNDRRPLQNPAGGLGGTVSPPVGPGQSPGGGPGGAKPSEALKILKFTLLKRDQKLTLVMHF